MQDQSSFQTASSRGGSNNQWLTIGEAAEFLNISRDTLRRWEKKGKIVVFRSPTNRRYYKKQDLVKLFSLGSEVPGQMLAKVSNSQAPVTARKTVGQFPSPLPPASVPTPAQQTYATVVANQPPVQTQVVDDLTKTEQKPAEPKALVADQQADEEILEIQPQPQLPHDFHHPGLGRETTKTDKGESKKERLPLPVLKMIILVASVVLIAAGLIIVGLVLWYPGDSAATSILSPV